VTKYSRLYRELILPAGLLSSLIIGAGMFALPFVFAGAGFVTGLFYLVVFTFAFSMIHRMYAEIIEGTSGKHRFVGYAEIYLKKFGFAVAIVTTLLGLIFALTAYVSLAGEFVGLVTPQFGITLSPYAFWVVGALAVILSFRRIAGLEFGVTLAIGFIVLVLFLMGVLRGPIVSIPLFDASGLFLPYGIVLFALSGRAAISSLADYYERRGLSNDKFHTAIRIGTVVPAFVYFIFALAIYWLSDGNVSEDALTGLTHLSPVILSMVAGLGIFALWTSYFFIGIEVRDIFRYDLKFPHLLAIGAVTFLPIILYTFGISSFIKLIGIAGGLFLAVESIVVVLIYGKLRGWSRLGKVLVALFAIGAFYQLLQFV